MHGEFNKQGKSNSQREVFPSETFIRLYRRFSERTRDIIDEHFTLALKVLFFKYKRKVREYETTLLLRKKKRRKRKYQEGPLLLKEKDIVNSIMLVNFHCNSRMEIDVHKNDDLTSNFGNFPLSDALRWYEEYLIKGNIQDVMARKIIFTENGKKFLYKEHTYDGAHVVSPENYVDARGRRLPWIRQLLRTTKEVYRQAEPSWETFLYVGVYKIIINKNTLYEKTVDNYFLAVIRRKSGQPLEFITAYFMDSQQELFKHLEQAHPLTLEQQEFIRMVENKVESKVENSG